MANDERPNDNPALGSGPEPLRDAWLTAALRHAPDAGAVPPAEVSTQILRAARSAVKPSNTGTPTGPGRLMQWWSWLARPPIAAGFATITVATVVGLMWWERPLDEVLPERSVPLATPAPATPPSVAAAPVPQPSLQGTTTSNSAANDAAKPTTQATPSASPPLVPSAPVPPAPARKNIAKREARSDTRAPADGARDRSVESAAAGATAAPVTAAPSPSRSPTQPPAPAPASIPTLPAPDVRAEARDARSGPAADAAAAKTAPPATVNAMRLRDADVASELAIDAPERWSWQRTGDPQPMTPALQRWLAQLERAARWQPAMTAVPIDAERLQLARDGAPRATIVLGPDAVWLLREGMPPLTAPLTPATAATLRATLDTAAP